MEATELLAKIKSQTEEQIKAFKGENSTEMEKFKSEWASLEAKLKAFNPEEVEKLKTELIALGGELKAMKEVAQTPDLKSEIELAMKSNPEALQRFKEGKDQKFVFEIKAAGTMTRANNATSPLSASFEVIPGLVDLVRNLPLIEQYSNTSSTNSATIYWHNKKNPDGQASFTAEGALKPLIDFDIVEETSTAKKIPAAIKVSKEMLDDISYMEAEIRNELMYQIAIEKDNKLISGNGVGVNPKGITEYASLYINTGVTTTTPGTADAILAAITQIRTFNFNANYVFISPSDWANLQLYKTTTGEYTSAIWINEGVMTVGGVRVVASNQIPTGFVLAGDFTRYIIRNYKSMTIEMGYENDDFRKNLVTVIAEERFHNYVSDNHTNAFVYDSIDNIKTAITA